MDWGGGVVGRWTSIIIIFLFITVYITVVSRVSAHGHINILTCDFGLHGRLPGIKIPYVCIEAATVAP